MMGLIPAAGFLVAFILGCDILTVQMMAQAGSNQVSSCSNVVCPPGMKCVGSGRPGEQPNCIPSEDPNPGDIRKCPNYPRNVACLIDPCKNNNCTSSQYCCSDYSTGCDFHCFTKARNGCPYFPPRVNCFVDPCQVNQCGKDQYCCSDYSSGCAFHCFTFI